METHEIISDQMKVCQKYDVPWFATPLDQMIAVSKDLANGVMPINGLRHPPAGKSVGWFVWAGGEINNDISTWDTIHAQHLIEKYPQILKYLGLPPGYRFQIDDKGYEDIWKDENLLNVD
jgi:hypothetical protein